MSNEDLLNKIDNKIEELLSLLKDYLSEDETIRLKLKMLNIYIAQLNDESIYRPFKEEAIFKVREAIKPFYNRLMNVIKTEKELKKEYDNLSDPIQGIYSWSYVLTDWEIRQESLAMYEDYLSILDQPCFTEEKLREAYDKSVNRTLYRDDNRMQLFDWESFKKQYENKILKPGLLYKERLGNIEFKMIYCPSGRFRRMKNEYFFTTIESPFSIGETEVTQELFQAIMGFNPSYFQGGDYQNSKQRPVEQVTWYDAAIFCNKLSEKLGRKPYYNISHKKYVSEGTKTLPNIGDADVTINPQANGFRLPLAKEWEYAAKAGTNNEYAGTNDEGKLDEIAWFRDNSDEQTHPVKGKRPNEWGLYDMSGNVSEWCYDMYGTNLIHNVPCGSSWYDHTPSLSSAFGKRDTFGYRNDRIGFRVSAYPVN